MLGHSGPNSNGFFWMIKQGFRTLWLLIVRNLSLKLFSVAFAAGLWILVNAGERDTEMSLTVPLEWRSLPPHLVVTGPQVDSVDVQVVVGLPQFIVMPPSAQQLMRVRCRLERHLFAKTSQRRKIGELDLCRTLVEGT